MAEPVYEVLWPLGKSVYEPVPLADQLSDLSGKTICELWDGLFKGDKVFPMVRESLAKRFPGVKFVEYNQFGNTHGPKEREVMAALPELLRTYDCDAVISGVGAWGSCTPAVVRASAVAERAGIRSVSVVVQGFIHQARATAKALGAENLAIAEYPGVILIDSEEGLRRKVEEVLVDNIVKGLAAPVKDAVKPVEPGARDIIFKGTLREVNKFFYERQWTEGLPIVPPTPDEVQRFLRFTDRSPDEVIGALLPENREATIWNIAVNGVMAGCLPEYLPILIAVVEAISEPEFRVEDAGSTPGWEPLIILNGPLIKELDFNCGAGVMRAGRQANTSIGRFLKLYMRNVAGVRILPGGTDKGSIAQNFNVVLAENEDAVAELGWQPFSVDRGFKAGENIVTVQSVVSVSPPCYSGGDTPLQHMETIAELIGRRSIAYWTPFGAYEGKFYPLLVVSPSVAHVMAKGGWTKDDMRQYLYDNVKEKAGWMEKLTWQTGPTSFSFCRSVEEGLVSREFCESTDPDRMVPVFIRPEWTGIVVSGDPDRNQSKGYVQNHKQGPPVSKRIQLPGKWRQLLE